MGPYVVDLREVDASQGALVGGKAANLGELCHVEGIQVPEGFCVLTPAFGRMLEETPAVRAALERLEQALGEGQQRIAEWSAALRRAIEEAPVPGEVAEEIERWIERLGPQEAYAVRSSATAEDLAAASFAGQYDSYLNVRGPAAILQQVRRCWASLYTERAAAYRAAGDSGSGGAGPRQARLAVIVQKMVPAQAAGVMFTADPLTGNRKVVSIDAGPGLGETLVGGLVNADTYKVRDGQVAKRKVAAGPDLQIEQVLADAQIVELAALGRRIEAHFGRPQDIEWCLAGGTFWFVQSRPITTLYPVPQASNAENHVYVSVGHQQMMTDAMKPLGISFFQLTAGRPMYAAGGRLFVDVTRELSSPLLRDPVVNGLGRSDPLLKDALLQVLERDGFLPLRAEEVKPPPGVRPEASVDPAVAAELVATSEAAVARIRELLHDKGGSALVEAIGEDIQRLKQEIMDPRSMAVIVAGMNAASWLNEKLAEWLGEKNVADTLAQSLPDNVTAQMGLELLDVADVLRPYPQVVDYLRLLPEDGSLDGLAAREGGPESRAAIGAWLDKYGMRCPGEIDITRPRWSEQPAALVPAILGNIKNFAPGEGRRRFAQGLQEAWQKEQEVLERLALLPEGEEKAAGAKRMIDQLRSCSGYREYPKYGIVSRYFVYKQALLREARRLVAAGVLAEAEDIYYLSFEELAAAAASGQVAAALIRGRKEEYQWYRRLAPPRVLTSEGEMLAGAYRRGDLPADALPGLPVSAGTVEGRARVLLRMEEAELEAGDILVTPFTDPSWTPLFVAIGGLVTEVGGLMTHGAVIAREYGIPAVVGVQEATRRIRDGQRIRVHGTEGYVEILA